MSEITKEVTLDPSVIPPLDPSVLTLSDEERAFLHATVSSDDDALKAKILAVQEKCVPIDSVRIHTYIMAPSAMFQGIVRFYFLLPKNRANANCYHLQFGTPLPMHPSFSLRKSDDVPEPNLPQGS